MPPGASTITIADGLTFPRLGFGAMRIIGAGTFGQPPDREVAKAVLRRAVDLGCTFLDTADAYGPEVSEELIAEALHPYGSDVVIATKGGLVNRGAPGQWHADGSRDHLRAACEGSLRRLRLDRIDLYQLHLPDKRVPFAESVGALAELRDEGKVRAIGLSNVTAAQLREAQAITPIASIQNRYGAGDRTSDDLVDLCAAEGIAFLPWAPLLSTGDDGAIAAAATRLGATAHQVALAWLLARSPAMVPIPGTGSVAHLEENAAAAHLELTPEEVAAISAGAPA